MWYYYSDHFSAFNNGAGVSLITYMKAADASFLFFPAAQSPCGQQKHDQSGYEYGAPDQYKYVQGYF